MEMMEPTEYIKYIRNLDVATLNEPGFPSNENMLYNIFFYASDQEILNFRNTPTEWLEHIYPEAWTYGPAFRDVIKAASILKTLDPDDPRLKLFEQDMSASLKDGLKASGASVYAYFYSSRHIENIFESPDIKFSHNYVPYFKSFLIAVVSKDMINKPTLFGKDWVNSLFSPEDYQLLTEPWNTHFGSLHKIE